MAEARAKLSLDNAEFNTGLQSSKQKLLEFNEALASPSSSIAKWALALPAIGGVIGLIQAGIGTVRAFGEGIENAFSSAMKRQELTADFQAFYGSVDASKTKIREFSDYARHTQFSTDDVAEGALRLEVLTNGAMQGAAALHIIGDVATDTGKNFTETSTAVGLLYSRIASGGAFERPLMALEKLGVITPVVSAKIHDMIDAGESTAATWKVVQDELDQFKGTTENVAATASGSLDKIRKNSSAIIQAWSLKVVDWMTPWLKRVAAQSDETRTNLSSWDGTWSAFLSGASVALFSAVQGFKNIGSALEVVTAAAEGFFQLISSGSYTLAKTAYDAATGNLSAALTDLKGGATSALQIVQDTSGKIGNIVSSRATGYKADYQAMADSIALINNPGLKPDLSKQTQFDPEDGEEPNPGNAEINRKQRELADIEASAREKTMTDLERINDLQQRRNALLAQATAEQDKISKLDPKQDQGAIAHLEGHKLDDQIAAGRLDEQIGQAAASREQKIAELKQKIQEHEDKLLDKAERLSSLQEQRKKQEADLQSPDELTRLNALATIGSIDDQIKELQKASGSGSRGGPNDLGRVGGGTRGVDYSRLFGLDDAKQQTAYQKQIAENTAKAAAGVAPGRFETALSTSEEMAFQKWKSQFAPNDSGADYDLRGAFKSGLTPSDNGHFPDSFKKPNHPTFSTESQYSQGPQIGGKWEKDGSFTPSAINLLYHSTQELTDYLRRVEPGSRLNLPTQTPTARNLTRDQINNNGNGPQPGPIAPWLRPNQPTSSAKAAEPVFTAAQRMTVTPDQVNGAWKEAQQNPIAPLTQKQLDVQNQMLKTLLDTQSILEGISNSGTVLGTFGS